MADYRQIATQAAQTYGIPVETFLSLLGAESSWNPNALSPKGAIGLGQLMPATAKELGVDPYDPEQNIYGSAKYLSQQFERFGDPALAVAAYNAGPSAVAKYGGVPPYEETQNYVARVMGTQMADQMIPQPMAPQQAAGYQPFSTENLPRNQRILLGLSALQDAAASLRGKQTSFFSEALGGLEQQHRYGQELAFRQGQEQRILGQERQTRELTMLQQRRLIQAERDKAYNLGMPTTGYDAQLAAVDAALSQMGSVFAPSVATAAPAAQPATAATAATATPAATGVEQPAAPTTLADANKLLTGGTATAEQLRSAADFFLRNDMTDRANMALDAAAQLEAQKVTETESAAKGAEQESTLRPRLDAVVNYLIEPNTGDINEDLFFVTEKLPANLQPYWYRDYVSALETINSVVGMKSLEDAKEMFKGVLSDRDIAIIFAQKGTFKPTDPIGTFRSVMQIYDQLGGAPAAGQARVISVRDN